MSAGIFTSITTSLKNTYTSKVVEPMVNETAPFRKDLSKNVPAGGFVSGGAGILKFAGNLAPEQNVGQLLDSGTLPPTKDRSDVQFQLTPTIFAAAVELGWLTRSAASSDKGAFNGGELRRRTNDGISTLGKFIESTYVGTHGTGRRARVSTDGSNTFVAALPEGTRLLRKNMYISARTTDGGASVRDSVDLRLITGIVHSTRTVTYDGADQTLVAGDHIYVVNELTQSFVTNPFANGLRGLVDDATYASSIHGLARATYPELNATVSSNGGTLRSLSESIMIQLVHEILARTGKPITSIWAPEGQIQKYVEFVAPDRRNVRTSKSDTGNMATGYREDDLLFYAPGIAVPLKTSFDMVAREMYFLNMDTFFHYQAKELGYQEGAGKDMLALIPTTSGYKAGYLGYITALENIGCDMPLANGVIRDLKDPSIGDA